MSKRNIIAMMFLLVSHVANAKTWYMATNGSDSNSGDIAAICTDKDECGRYADDTWWKV